MSTNDIAVRDANGRDVATYDTAEGVIRIPTQVSGVHLTFAPDQRVLNDAQMVLLSPLGVEAGWDPRQVAVFLMECQERGLNPWNREAYLMQYAGKYIRHIGIDGFRKRGESTGEYRGRVGPYWCDTDGKWLEFWPHRDRPPVATKVGLKRAGFDDIVWAVAMYDEFVPMNDEKVWDPKAQRKVKTGRKVVAENWRTAADGGKPSVMLAKVAEAQAWRVTFPERFGGFYAPEEFDRHRTDQHADDPAAEKRRAAFAAAQTAAQPAQVVDGTVEVAAEVLSPYDDERDRPLLLAELDEQAEVLGKSVAALCERWSASRNGRAIDTATVDELADHVHRIRSYVRAALREQNRDAEAERYEQAPLTGTAQDLFGRGPVVVEPPADMADGSGAAQ